MTRVFVFAAFALVHPLALGVTLSATTPAPTSQSTAASGGSTVTGLVSASTGRPLARATVMLRRHTGARAAASSTVAPFQMVTDREGRFSFTNIPAGAYTLTAAREGYLPARFGQRAPTDPGRPLVVPAGQTVRADLTAFPDGGTGRMMDTAVSVRGSITASSGAPAVRAAISVFRADAAGANAVSIGNVRFLPNGRFIIDDLPPGEYIVAAESMRPHDTGIDQRAESAYARLRVSVPASALDLSLRLRPAARVHVKIQSPIRLPEQVAVLLQAEDGLGASHMTTTSGGPASMPAHPGRYRIRVKELPPGWIVDRVIALGRDVMRSPFVVEGGEDIDVTVALSPDGASVVGSFLLSAPQARSACTVVVLSARADDRTPAAEGVKVRRSDRHGTFAVQGLRAGVYYVAAVERVEPAEIYDSTFWKTIEAEGTRVSLAARERRTMLLRCAPSTPRPPNEQE